MNSQSEFNFVTYDLVYVTLWWFRLEFNSHRIHPFSLRLEITFFFIWGCIFSRKLCSLKWIACNFDGYISRGGNPHSVWLTNKPVKLSSELFVNLDKSNISKVQTIDRSLLNPQRALLRLQMIHLIIWSTTIPTLISLQRSSRISMRWMLCHFNLMSH